MQKSDCNVKNLNNETLQKIKRIFNQWKNQWQYKFTAYAEKLSSFLQAMPTILAIYSIPVRFFSSRGYDELTLFTLMVSGFFFLNFSRARGTSPKITGQKTY